MLRLLPQAKNLEDAQTQKCQQCQVLLSNPSFFSATSPLQSAPKVQTCNGWSWCPISIIWRFVFASINSILNTVVTACLILPSTTLYLTQQKPKSSQYLQGPIWSMTPPPPHSATNHSLDSPPVSLSLFHFYLPLCSNHNCILAAAQTWQEVLTWDTCT